MESAYEIPLRIQLAKKGLRFDHQRVIPLVFGGVRVGDYKPDLRITGLRRGLILNFNKAVLKAGIKRVTRFD